MLRKPIDQSSDEEAQCELSGSNGALETAWISAELVALTQNVWAHRLGRAVPRDEAVEMLLNVKRIAMVFHGAKEGGQTE